MFHKQNFLSMGMEGYHTPKHAYVYIYTPSVFCYDKHKKNFDIQFSMKRHAKFTRGPSVASYLHEKQTSRIQSLNEWEQP